MIHLQQFDFFFIPALLRSKKTDQCSNRALKPVFITNTGDGKTVLIVEFPARIAAVRVKTHGADLTVQDGVRFFSVYKNAAFIRNEKNSFPLERMPSSP